MFVHEDTPNTTLEVDFDSNPTDLYQSITNSEWSTAAEYIKLNPIEVQTWVTRKGPDGGIIWRFLPLHSACARQPPVSIVDSLLRQYPEAAMEADDQGMLPLHYACGNLASEDVIHLLLVANPRSIFQKEPQGDKLPLHFVCEYGASCMSVLHMLVAVFPESIIVSDKDGNTPLDLEEDPEILDLLGRCGLSSRTQAYSAAFRIMNDEGVDKEKLEELEEKVKSLIIEKGELEEDISAKEKRITKLEQNLDFKDDDAHRLRDDKKSLKKMICMISEEKDSLREELAGSKVTVEGLEKEKRDLLEQIEEARKKNETLAQQKLEEMRISEEKRDEINKLKEERMCLEGVVVMLRKEKKDVENEKENLQEHYEILEKKRESAVAGNKNLREQHLLEQQSWEAKCANLREEHFLEQQSWEAKCADLKEQHLLEQQSWETKCDNIKEQNRMLVEKVLYMTKSKQECKKNVHETLIKLEAKMLSLFEDVEDVEE